VRRVVDEYVDRPKRRLRPVEQRARRIALGQIHLPAVGPPTSRSDLAHDVLGRSRLQIVIRPFAEHFSR
jgi:hypothetical protein